MTLPCTVADVLTEHVVFEVECIDRMYCNVYVPQLQHAGGLLGFVQRHLGFPVASTAPLAKITHDEGVVFIGRAQEKTKLFRTEKRRDRDGRSYPWIVASTGVVNQFH